MHRVFGTAISFIFIFTIVGFPGPFVDTKDVATQKSKDKTEASIEYPTQPPDPLEWFHSRYTVRSFPTPSSTPTEASSIHQQETANNETPKTSEKQDRMVRLKEKLGELRKKFRN